MTQQQMAERLAISRVAVSHLESCLTPPSERTVTLIAGLFKLEPWQLVRDTDYPVARAERLPSVVTRYTQAELLTTVVDALVESLADPDRRSALVVLEPWRARAWPNAIWLLTTRASAADDAQLLVAPAVRLARSSLKRVIRIQRVPVGLSTATRRASRRACRAASARV